jgi:hypothetical protein
MSDRNESTPKAVWRGLSWACLPCLALLCLAAAHAWKPRVVDDLTLVLGLVALVVLASAVAVAVKPEILGWAQRHVASLNIAGFVVLSLAQPTTTADDVEEETESPQLPSGLKEVRESVASQLERAAGWTKLTGYPYATIHALVRELARGGYIDRFDRAMLELLFSPSASTSSDEANAAARDLRGRLQTQILIRAAELSFERRGLAPHRPGAPFSTLHYHFMVTVPDGCPVYVAVVVSRENGSKLTPRRARDIGAETCLGGGVRWLVSNHAHTSEVAGVRIIDIQELDTALQEHLAKADSPAAPE